MKLRYQQPKTILFVYRLLNQNYMGNANQKTTTGTHKEKNNPNTALKMAIKPQEKRTKEKWKEKHLHKETQSS